MKKKKSLALKISLGLILGIIFGVLLYLFGSSSVNARITKCFLDPLGNVFLRSIKFAVVPVVFFSIVVGTASIGNIKKLGRIGGKTIGFYLCTTAIAVTIALLMGNLLKPGLGLEIAQSAAQVETTAPPFILDIFVNMIPTNPIESLVKGDMLQIIVFAIMFGIGLTLVGEKSSSIMNACSNINDVFLKIIGIVMLFAPIGVFALISKVVINLGVTVLLSLMKYILVFLLALLIHIIVVYMGVLKFIGKQNPIKFFKKFFPAMICAFSTSSSSATIPVSLNILQNKMGVSSKVSSFTIPLGATVNMDGTAIMQGVAALFIAQFFGIDVTIQQQLMIILTATLASIGTAGVPGAGVVMLTMVLQQVGLPLEGIALVLSVDRIVDMFRTAVNVTGDAVCTIIVAKSENEFNETEYNS